MAAQRASVALHAPPVDAHVRADGLGGLLQSRLDEAHRRGYAEGLAASLESGAQALEHAAERLDAASERAVEELAHQTAELAVEIARQLLKIHVEAGDYDLERIVRGALSDAGVGRGSVVVHVHPDDHARLQGVLFRSGTEIELDPALARGHVHLSTPRGLLVRDLDAALDSIREQLLEDLA